MTPNYGPEYTEQYARGFGKGFTDGVFSRFSEANGGWFSEGFKNILDEIFKNLGEAVGDITNSIFREITFNSVPYIASALFTICGAPLGAFYVYRRAIHQLEKPKLIAEEHMVGKLDRIQARIKAVALGTLQALTSGVKWGATTGFLATAAYLPTIISYLVLKNPGYKDFERFDDNYRALGILGTAGAASLAILSTAGRNIRGWMQKTFFAKPDPTPIFEEALTHRIEDISHHIRNLLKHGGDLQNVLLYGPGGTGKTMVAKIIAKESNLNYIFMSGGDLAQYIQKGEHVTQLKKLFEHINNSHTPTILFIDEIESLCSKREKMDAAHLELLNSFLSFTGEPSKQFMIIGATNKPEFLDEAVLNRMDYKLKISPPGKEQRLAILEQYIRQFFDSSAEIEETFPAALKNEIVEQTEGFTGRALRKFVNALHSKKMCTDENRLTEKMIRKELDHWIKQEQL